MSRLYVIENGKKKIYILQPYCLRKLLSEFEKTRNLASTLSAEPAVDQVIDMAIDLVTDPATAPAIDHEVKNAIQKIYNKVKELKPE